MTSPTKLVTLPIKLRRRGFRSRESNTRSTISTKLPNRTTSSRLTSTSAMVMFTFSTETITPALTWTRPATLAFKLRSACSFSTINSMRPTWSSGTWRRTSGTVEVLETLGADVVGVVLVLLEAVALPAGSLAAPPVALADAVPVMGGVSTEAAELVCANTCAAKAKRKVTNRRRIENDMLA